MKLKLRSKIAFTALAGGALALSGCTTTTTETTSESATDPLKVVAAFYPLQFLADRVGEDQVTVSSLTQGGGEAHDVELSAQQVVEIAEADLVLYIKGFQPAVDAAVEQEAPDTSMNLAKGLETLTQEEHDHEDEEGDEHSDEGDHDHEGEEETGKSIPDPHVWLDPANMITMAESLQTRMTELSPDAEQAFTTHTARISEHLTTLDEDWKEGTAKCESRELVVSHEAFGYLGQAYDLTQVGIAGLEPESEPSPARIAEMADLASSDEVTTIYYESSVEPEVAQTIADEAGVVTRVLDPLENEPDAATGDYLSAMLRNLQSVQEGLRCS
ncbi:metal ABC transporter substrate-binding protein [Candidatus Nanopelagicales bacterium]|nr:metal ABC transporter substrate-binding protein [Candidatus Nanopelagicales bacterium]